MYFARTLLLIAFVGTVPAQLDAAAPNEPASADQEVFFETKVRPVLAEHCFSCHGPEKQKSGLRLDSRAAVLQGSGSRAVVVPGDAAQSALVTAVKYEGDIHMPPAGKLPDPAIDALSKWVQMGAPWPADHQASPLSQPASEDDIQRARRTHWSFRQVRNPAPPKVTNADWCENDVDRFIAAALEAKSIELSPRADRRTLIRRATFDLHGLPPTPKEIDAFVNDPASDTVAFAALVDRLLAPPRYGERWGRHWLDVARYADTKGYVFLEERRFAYSWTYRDFVIRAFNEDLPFNQFILHQLAADLLPHEDDPSPLAAMGYLTLGRRFINNINDIIDDRIDVVSRGMLGLTVSCARCHDHKFDPIPTADYYSLYGVFASSTEPVEKPLIGKPQDNAAYRAFVKELDAKKRALDEFTKAERESLLRMFRAQTGDYLLKTLTSDPNAPAGGMILTARDLRPAMTQRWKAFVNETATRHSPVFAPWHALAALKPNEFAARAPVILADLTFRPEKDPAQRVNWPILQRLLATMPISMGQVSRAYGDAFAEVDAKWQSAFAASTQPTGAKPLEALPDPQEEELRQVLYGAGAPAMLSLEEAPKFFEQSSRTKYRQLHKDVESFQSSSVNAPPAAMTLAETALYEPHVFVRGNPANPGKAVPRQFLAVLSPTDRKPFSQGSGRLEMAKAIASRDNPLTARVLVNRVWLHHFGAGLVRTPSDFGTRGDPPTHPELLDYLAFRFMEEGWSIKKLHRLIMLSSTYRQSSDETERAHALDPENRLLHHMNRRRLDFESMRDALLAVSGKLDLTVGGPSVDISEPPFPPRRSVYGLIDRQNLPPIFRMFDFASPDSTNAQRYQTTVPQQALFLMNSPFVVQQARQVLRRSEVVGEPQTSERIRHLYQLAFGRKPTQPEIAIGTGYVEGPVIEAGGPEPRPVVWKYGQGHYDPASKRVTRFIPLPRFHAEQYCGPQGPPDAELGWVLLTRDGGHPGDAEHQAIRRWVAPISGAIKISGALEHPPRQEKCGNGVQGWIVSSRMGELGHYAAERGKTPTNADARVEPGDTIDFVVDGAGDVTCDSFNWAPVIRAVNPPGKATQSAPSLQGSANGYAGKPAGPSEWEARTDFAPPPAPPEKPLNAWEQYAQALLLANEFVFID